ncbi:ABC transporter ATP-binding protein [Shinella sp. S4-D37]|uniref:iron ABC transporter ATP-binding protein n=1 Tax=Shinella sp. S4-D37 TaxID=3161999 RepID=UPI003465E23A
MIRVENAIKRYGETIVVDGVSLEFAGGGVTAIIGPNGAGKSTLLSMVSRLIALDAGTVSIDGLDVTKTASDVLARRLSILRQDNQMASRLTVGDLVAFGRYPYSRGRLTVEDARHIEDALGYVDLSDLRDRFLDQLSGGQRQRAFVAMVLCQDTDYVLFDEPLNNLDIRHAVSMMRMIRRAADELGKTVVVVLHDINFASCHADHIIAMREGRILRQGPPEEIIDPVVLEALYGTTFEVKVSAGKRLANYYF